MFLVYEQDQLQGIGNVYQQDLSHPISAHAALCANFCSHSYSLLFQLPPNNLCLNVRAFTLAGKRSKHMFISMEGVTVLVSGTQLSRQCMHDGVVPCNVYAMMIR